MTNIHFADASLSLEQLETRGARAAASLAERGIGEGDVIAIVLRNDPVVFETLTAIRCLGATRALLPWHLQSREFRRIVAAIKPRVIITQADLYPQVAAATDLTTTLVIVNPVGGTDDPLNLERITSSRGDCLHWTDLVNQAIAPRPLPATRSGAISVTSGSTGQPKVMRWDTAPPLGPRYYQRMAQCPAIKTAIVTAPLCNSAQAAIFNQAWYARANQVILPEFEPEAFLAAVERHRVNHAFLMPTMFVRLLRLPQCVREKYDVSSLNFVFHTGALCAPGIKRRMIDWWGPIIWEAYGCSETSIFAMSDSHEWLARPGTVGQPMRPVVVLNDAGDSCAPNEIGQIAVDTAGLPPSHYDNNNTSLWARDGVQYMATGDLGWRDADGYLYLRGRIDDLINTGRIQVYPAEIENALLEHPAVLDCVVFPIPNPEFGKFIAAIVEVTEPNMDVDTELREFLKGRISSHKIPVKISLRTTPIRTPAGKINRAVLAAAMTCV